MTTLRGALKHGFETANLIGSGELGRGDTARRGDLWRVAYGEDAHLPGECARPFGAPTRV